MRKAGLLQRVGSLSRQGNLSSLAESLVNDDECAVIARLQLFVGVEQLDPVHGAVRGEVDVEGLSGSRLFVRSLGEQAGPAWGPASAGQ